MDSKTIASKWETHSMMKSWNRSSLKMKRNLLKKKLKLESNGLNKTLMQMLMQLLESKKKLNKNTIQLWWEFISKLEDQELVACQEVSQEVDSQEPEVLELEQERELFSRRTRLHCPRITMLASIIQIPPDSGSSVPFLDRGFLEFLPESLKVPSCLPLPSMMVMGASCSQTYSLMTKGKE